MVLDIEEDPKIPRIFGRPFMNNARKVMDFDKGQVKVGIKNHDVCFYMIGIT